MSSQSLKNVAVVVGIFLTFLVIFLAVSTVMGIPVGDCGSVIEPARDSPYQFTCDRAISDRRYVVIGLAVSALALVIWGFIRPPVTDTQAEASAAFRTSGEDTPKSDGSGNANLSEELTQIHELHEAGALTDDEYQAAKARLLGT